MADGSEALCMPGATARDIALGRMPNDPASLLHESLYPEDAYHGQTYWVDLPSKEQAKWVSEQKSEEAARKFGPVWQNFKTDPLKPFSLYFRNYAVTVYASSPKGTLCSLLEIASQCMRRFGPRITKNTTFVIRYGSKSIDCLEIVGILLGQIIVGFIGIVDLMYYDLLHQI